MKLLTAAALASTLLTGNAAHAAFIAYICDDIACTGGGDTIVTDQGAGDNFPGSAFVGQINAGALNVAGFTIVTNVAQSKPLIGSAAQPQMSLVFSAVTSDSLAHTVYLYASDTGFTGSGEAVLTLGGNQNPSTGGNSVKATAWGGSSNSNLDLAHLVATASSQLSPFDLSATALFSPVVNPYSLTIGIAITRNTAGTTSGGMNLTINSVPEPTSIVLAALALISLPLAARMRPTPATRRLLN